MKLRAAITSALMTLTPLLATGHSTVATTESDKFFESSMISLNGSSISKAKIKGEPASKVGYHQWQLKICGMDQGNDGKTHQTIMGAGIKTSNLSWKSSPYYKNRSQYNLVLNGSHQFDFELPFALHGDAQLELSLESTQLTRYSYAIVDLYGSQEWNNKVISLGIYGEIGRQSHTLLPIIGLHTVLERSWILDLLFPYYGKVTYNFNDSTDFYFAVRSLKDRQRVKASDPSPRAIWQYHATTAALGVAYRYHEMIRTHAEIGKSVNPTLRCYNSRGAHLATHRIKDSLYAQVALDIIF